MNIALHGKNLNKKKLLVLEAIIENIRSNEINIYTSKELKQNLTNKKSNLKKISQSLNQEQKKLNTMQNQV